MNAIVNLNHFCEIHGPQTIFSTQTMREKSLLGNSSGSSHINNCCGSIGNKVIFVTEDKDSSIMFVSSEKSIFGKENQNSLKTTALRSLSCEVRKDSTQISTLTNLNFRRSRRTTRKASYTSAMRG